MKRKLVTLFLAIGAVVGVFAYDFQSGDLYYNITSANAPYTVEVTYKSQWKNYLTQSEITIPKTVTYNGKTYSVTSIGDAAFYGYSGLESIVLKTPTPPAAGGSLVSDYSLNGGCLYVPCGAVRAYQKAKEWRKFTQKQTFFPHTVSIAANDSLAGAVQIDQEPTCGNAEAIVSAIPDNGYEFVQWSDGNTDNPRKLLVDSDINLTALFR